MFNVKLYVFWFTGSCVQIQIYLVLLLQHHLLGSQACARSWICQKLHLGFRHVRSCIYFYFFLSECEIVIFSVQIFHNMHVDV